MKKGKTCCNIVYGIYFIIIMHKEQAAYINPLHCSLGYANFGNNENFHLIHFEVHQTNDRE